MQIEKAKIGKNGKTKSEQKQKNLASIKFFVFLRYQKGVFLVGI